MSLDKFYNISTRAALAPSSHVEIIEAFTKLSNRVQAHLFEFTFLLLQFKKAQIPAFAAMIEHEFLEKRCEFELSDRPFHNFIPFAPFLLNMVRFRFYIHSDLKRRIVLSLAGAVSSLLRKFGRVRYFEGSTLSCVSHSWRRGLTQRFANAIVIVNICVALLCVIIRTARWVRCLLRVDLNTRAFY